MSSERTKGIIDLHIHSAPDVRQRKMNDIELMEAGVRLGARALVIKSHLVPTMDRQPSSIRSDRRNTRIQIWKCLEPSHSTVP